MAGVEEEDLGGLFNGGEDREAGISVYHGMIKGFMRVKSAGEATEVFRKMIRSGQVGISKLWQAHLGKGGRKERDPLVNLDTIFVGGLVKAGMFLEATKYLERAVKGGPDKLLEFYLNEEGVAVFEEIAKKLREEGLFDLADIFDRYGKRWLPGIGVRIKLREGTHMKNASHDSICAYRSISV